MDSTTIAFTVWLYGLVPAFVLTIYLLKRHIGLRVDDYPLLPGITILAMFWPMGAVMAVLVWSWTLVFRLLGD